MRSDLPTGTVTFLFTHVEGSTRLLRELGAEAYADALAEHRPESCAGLRMARTQDLIAAVAFALALYRLTRAQGIANRCQTLE